LPVFSDFSAWLHDFTSGFVLRPRMAVNTHRDAQKVETNDGARREAGEFSEVTKGTKKFI
jgi:hypothetical protein